MKNSKTTFVTVNLHQDFYSPNEILYSKTTFVTVNLTHLGPIRQVKPIQKQLLLLLIADELATVEIISAFKNNFCYC